MHGRIEKFSAKDGFGVIQAEDGSRYRFTKTEVVNLNGKLVGHSVDFIVSQRRPKEIILMTGSPWTVFGGAKH
jgi:cold shock CspA family protein